jgi:hypothetical protein
LYKTECYLCPRLHQTHVHDSQFDSHTHIRSYLLIFFSSSLSIKNDSFLLLLLYCDRDNKVHQLFALLLLSPLNSPITPFYLFRSIHSTLNSSSSYFFLSPHKKSHSFLSNHFYINLRYFKSIRYTHTHTRTRTRTRTRLSLIRFYNRFYH